jgi:CHAT domain-containing protein
VLTTQLALGDALAAVGRPASALAAYDRAARTVERITVGLRGDVDRAGYRERHLRPFDGALVVLLGAATPPLSALDAALLWAERRKAAALALATAGAAHGPAPLDRVALQGRLEPREALVDYLVSDSLVAAVVLTDRAATVVRLPLTRDSLTRLVERLRRPLITTYAGRLDLARAPYDLPLAHFLYAALIRPLEPALAGRDRWLIVPDGPLHALPFEALVTRQPPAEHPGYAAAQYLLDQAQVTYLPSAQFLAAPGDRARTLTAARVLAVAGDAPGGAREVGAVRAAFSPARVRVLSQGGASETAIRAAGPRYAIVHFATHAEANNADPLASHLRLAPDGVNDGYFHVNEIAGTRWHTRLVVLSACETLGGRLYEGEGLMGLARAFLASGAEAVVATQWPVGAGSADVMAVFYRGLSAGSAPDAALRDAQLALRRNAATSHPFYWGGFALVRGRVP